MHIFKLCSNHHYKFSFFSNIIFSKAKCMQLHTLLSLYIYSRLYFTRVLLQYRLCFQTQSHTHTCILKKLYEFRIYMKEDFVFSRFVKICLLFACVYKSLDESENKNFKIVIFSLHNSSMQHNLKSRQYLNLLKG